MYGMVNWYFLLLSYCYYIIKLLLLLPLYVAALAVLTFIVCLCHLLHRYNFCIRFHLVKDSSYQLIIPGTVL